MSASGQTTIHVPTDQPTIQAGIDAAQNGDTVLVAPGTYQESIDFKGKAIIVTSGATTSDGSAATIIQAPTSAAAVTFQSGEPLSAVLNGFTITHPANIPTTAVSPGTAISISHSSATITNNLITGNPGYGIKAVITPSLLIQGNNITANPSIGQLVANAIEVDTNGGNIQLLGNRVTNNPGTIYIQNATSALLQNNVVAQCGNGIAVFDTLHVAVIQNLVYNNADDNYSGVEIGNSPADPGTIVVTNNTIASGPSLPASWNPQKGSALFVNGLVISQTISNNLIIGKASGQALACQYEAADFTPTGPPANAIFSHNDVYQDGNAQSYQCASPSNTFANISADPQFIDYPKGNLHVQLTSPILAAGDHNAPMIPSADLVGKNRFVCGTVDLGVYEVHPRPATVVTSSNNPSVGGSSVTFSATVPGNCNVPTGTVTFMDGAASLGTVALNSSAAASISTSSLTVGNHTITVTYPGDFNFYKSVSAPLTQVVTGYPTTTTLSVSPNPAGAFTPITLNSSVSSNFGQPTGTVVFTFGGRTLAAATVGANGQATATVSSLGSGSYSIVATYQANTTFATSNSATVNETVVGAESVTSLNAVPNPALATQTVTLTAAVRAAQGSAIPTGTVTFSDGSTVLGSTALNASGTATLSTSALAIGTHTITASYGGSANFNPSSASVAETVTAISTTTSLTASPNPAGQGQTVTLTASVTSATGATPSGSVTFADGTPLGTAPLNSAGVATFTISRLAVGVHSITAVYSGGGSFGGSTSLVFQETIIAAGFNLSLSPATITVRVGESATATVELGSYGDYAGSLTLSTSSLPAYLAASLSPSQLTLPSNGSAKSTLTISTSIVPSRAQIAHTGGSRIFSAGALVTFLLTPFAIRRRRRFSSLAVIIVGLGLLTTLSGCGGIIEIPVHFVKPGTYVIPVTATGTSSKTAQLTVVVTP